MSPWLILLFLAGLWVLSLLGLALLAVFLGYERRHERARQRHYEHIETFEGPRR